MKNQSLVSGGILITFLFLTGCGENNSDSATVSSLEISNPTVTATPITQTSPIATEKPSITQTSPIAKENPVSQTPSRTQTLKPGTYCYTTNTKTLDAKAKINISSNNQVNGTVEATIHNEAQGYYSSYVQNLKGKLVGEKAKLNIVTKIELDTQNSQEDWTIKESSLNTDRETFRRVDCTHLGNGQNSIKPIRVKFDRGRTSKTVSNSVVRGTRDTYLLGAKKGQQMNLQITSLENNAVFDVISPIGKTLQGEAKNWSGTLPVNGDYQVVVSGTRGNATYELNIEIK